MVRVLLCCTLSFLIAAIPQLSAQTRRSPTRSDNKSQACGPISDGALKCTRFGFSYKIPFGWVDRTDDMRGENEADTESTTKSEAASSKSQTLLAIFERPPGAPGEIIYSAVVIAAESADDNYACKLFSYYLGSISEFA